MIPVLYIAGAGRSGSTLLSFLLGNLPGFCDVGELSWLWQHAEAGRRCGCGLLLRDCGLWTEVLVRLQEHHRVDPSGIARLSLELQETRTLGSLRPHLPGRKRHRMRTELDRATARLYRTVADLHPGAVIVDASKTPTHLATLQRLPDLDLRVLHLVRDGRAVAYSWSKRGGNPAAYRSLYTSMLAWMVENVLLERLLRDETHRACLRYEDLVSDPPAALGETLRRLSLPVPTHALVGRPVGATHGIGGNRQVRRDAASLEVALDSDWRWKLSPRQRMLLTVEGYPALRRYGYALGTSR